MGRRTLLLVAAVLLAAIGTGVLFVYLRATSGSLGKASSTERTVDVAVPALDVPEGTRIVKNDQFRFLSMPATVVAAGGYVSRETFDQYVGKVATRRLAALTPVTASAFGDIVNGTSTIPLTPGTMNLAVEMEDPARVGTFLYPGARIAVWVVDPDTMRTEHQASVVLPEVTVVTTGSAGVIRSPSATRTATSRGASGIVVLRVNQDQAGRLLVAQKAGELYFTLLGDKTTATPGSYDETDITAVP